MSESLLENNFSVELKNSRSTDNIRLDVDYAQEYREYKNGHLVKAIKLDHDDLLLILLENRIADLQKEGFVCLPPLYSPNSECVVSDQYIEHIEGDEDCEYLIGPTGELYCRFSELDLVSLHDVYTYLCENSGVAELQLPPEKLNCVHVGELRRLFYRPEVKRLRYLVIDCGFDSLSAVLKILAEANMQALPISLNLDCECSKDPHQFPDASLLTTISIKSFGCRFVDHLILFDKYLSSLVSLSLSNLIIDDQDNRFYKKDVPGSLQFLENCFLPKLKSLNFYGVANEKELAQLLNLSLIVHLEKLHIRGAQYASNDLPIEYLLEESVIPKWRHLKELLLDGHYVYEDKRKLFESYSQITFY